MNLKLEKKLMLKGDHIEMINEQKLSDYKYKLETTGYVIVPNFLTQNKCEELKRKLMEQIDCYNLRENSRSKLDRYHIHDLLVKDVSFGKLLEDERLQKLVALLLKEYWVMYAFTSSSLPPNESNYGGRLHVDSPRFIRDYPTNVGVIWALDPFTIENGCTKMLPASHHSLTIPRDELFQEMAENVICNKGDLIIFNARVWHRAGFNNSNQWRHALTMNCCRPFMKQRMDWVRFIPKEIAEQLNDQAKRILGYDTRLPVNLDEFFVDASKRLYKPGQE
jgi:ectoine hydroxylase-related dioxygenase (phytanoyl-CoA dioxygenase family)